MYTIQAYGKTYTFPTIEAARAVASEYMIRTGIIVGIVQVAS